MIVFLLLLLLVISNSAEIAPEGVFHRDYLSRGTTTAVKGVFVILIVFSHFSQYVTLEGVYDEGYVCLQNHLNQMVVAMFLFYSGYGIMESIKKKGYTYITEFPVKRFLTVFLDLAAAIVIFLLVDWAMGIHYSWSAILLSFIGWSNVGNSSWYMFAIFALYLGTWISFVFLKKMKPERAQWVGTIILTLLTMVFVFWQMKIGREKYSYDTDILYVAGMWFSLIRERAEKWIMKNSLWFAVSCLLTGAVYELAFRKRWASIEWYSVWGLAFVTAVLLFTMKIRIGNPVLNWFGSHIFGVYILQRIPMMILSKFGAFSGHKYVFLTAVFLCLVPMVMLFDRLTGGIHKGVSRWTGSLPRKTAA